MVADIVSSFTGTKHSLDPLPRSGSVSLESPIFNEFIELCTDDKVNQRPPAAEIETALNLYQINQN